MAVVGQVDLISLADDFRNAGESIDLAAAKVVRETAEAVVANAVAMAPKRTGAMADSITIRYINPTTAEVGPASLYSLYVEMGTKPHVIKPKSPGGVLVFKVGGKTVYARSVNHPGTKPQPFMRPALEQALGSSAGRLADAGVLLITKGDKA